MQNLVQILAFKRKKKLDLLVIQCTQQISTHPADVPFVSLDRANQARGQIAQLRLSEYCVTLLVGDRVT